jgi:hypothetical protein
MDFLDLIFAALPLNWPGSPSRERSPGENLTGALSMMIFPLLALLIVLLAGVQDPMLALVGIPVWFAAASLLLSWRLRLSTGWTIGTSLGCAVACFVTSGCAYLLGVFASFYSGF